MSYKLFYAFALFLLLPVSTFAATFSVSPTTGSYTVGDMVRVTVLVSSPDRTINSLGGTLTFPSDIFTVQSTSKANSIISVWTNDPHASQSNGTITFEGLVPAGYRGVNGTVFSFVLKAKNSGTANISFSEGEILAADGSGTNVQTGLFGASYTIKVSPVTVQNVAPGLDSAQADSSTNDQDQQIATSTDLSIMDFTAPVITTYTARVEFGSNGSLSGTSHNPGATAELRLTNNSDTTSNIYIYRAVVQPDGSFTFSNLNPNERKGYSAVVVVEENGQQTAPSTPVSIEFSPESPANNVLGLVGVTLAILALIAIALSLFYLYLYRQPKVMPALQAAEGNAPHSSFRIKSHLSDLVDALEHTDTSHTPTPIAHVPHAHAFAQSTPRTSNTSDVFPTPNVSNFQFANSQHAKNNHTVIPQEYKSVHSITRTGNAGKKDLEISIQGSKDHLKLWISLDS